MPCTTTEYEKLPQVETGDDIGGAQENNGDHVDAPD